MVLDELTIEAELALGAPLAQLLPISTEVLELEVTPNRPDCLGVYGVARELHAATGAPLAARALDARIPARRGPLRGAAARRSPCSAPISARASPRACSRTSSIGPSPPWLAARLLAAGQRPINNVVDITNYAMLLTGQPLHAFDLDRVSGGRLTVRRAHDGEQVQTLDGQTRTLDGEMVLIEDGEGPTSIAGVMGGARSEVSGRHHARADGGRQLGRARTSTAPRGRSGCAARPPRALRRASRPSSACGRRRSRRS